MASTKHYQHAKTQHTNKSTQHSKILRESMNEVQHKKQNQSVSVVTKDVIHRKWYPSCYATIIISKRDNNLPWDKLWLALASEKIRRYI